MSLLFLTVTLGGQVRLLGSDGDIGYHLRLGNEMLAHGALVTTNTLTSTNYEQPFIAWEWLSEIVYAGIWHLFGLNGVVVVVGAVVAVTMTLLFRAIQQRGTPLLLALPLTLAAAALTSIHWLARPHLFSLLLTLWWSEQLWSYWQSGNVRKLWPLPLVMALWANLHAGFVAGLIMLGAATVLVWLFPNTARTHDVAARRWQLVRALVACFLATLLTPYGLLEPLHIVSFLSNSAVLGAIQEYNSPDFHQGYGQLFLVLLLLLGACGVFRGWRVGGRTSHPVDLPAGDEQRQMVQLATRKPDVLGWLLAGIFTAMALISVRFLPLWAVVVTPLLGRELTCWLAEWAAADTKAQLGPLGRVLFQRSWQLTRQYHHLHSWPLATLTASLLLMVLLGGGILPGTSVRLLNAHFSSSAFPVEAAQAIQQGAIQGGALPVGAGFTTTEWAGYLELMVPQRLVIVDSRVDFFGERVMRDYLTMLDGGPGWNTLIDQYRITWFLIPPMTSLAHLLVLMPTWNCQMADAQQVALLCLPAPASPAT